MDKKILVLRLGAMGDILHAMPAVHALKGAEIAWLVEPRWMPLLAGSGLAQHLVPMNRRSASSVWIALRWLRRWQPDVCIDFQGLLKSAAAGRMSGAGRRIGFAPELLREREAALFYSELVSSGATHVVEQNLDLARHAGKIEVSAKMPLPLGLAEGNLPGWDFVLAAPFAGWRSKQWPLENYVEIGRRLKEEMGVDLVMNVMPRQELPASEFLWRHESSLEGLIDATRRAKAVLGLDSGPMHLAALMGKPGVALFGPTDPSRNGPYGGSLKVLRQEGCETTYKRGGEIAESMKALSVDAVWQALR